MLGLQRVVSASMLRMGASAACLVWCAPAAAAPLEPAGETVQGPDVTSPPVPPPASVSPDAPATPSVERGQVRVRSLRAEGSLCSMVEVVPIFGGLWLQPANTSPAFLRRAQVASCTLTMELEVPPELRAAPARFVWEAVLDPFSSNDSHAVVWATHRVGGSVTRAGYKVVNDADLAIADPPFIDETIGFELEDKLGILSTSCVNCTSIMSVEVGLEASLIGPETPAQSIQLIWGRLELGFGR